MATLDRVFWQTGYPKTVRVDHGSEFASRDLDLWAYAQQLAALNKHRGKGQQKVTVEYVNVEAGGQAIFGNAETKRNDPRVRSAAKPQSNDAEVPFAVEPLGERVPRSSGSGWRRPINAIRRQSARHSDVVQ